MSRAAGTNGRYLPLAEIRDARQNVRFRGQSGHPLGLDECLLMTHSGYLIGSKALLASPPGVRADVSDLCVK